MSQTIRDLARGYLEREPDAGLEDTEWNLLYDAKQAGFEGVELDTELTAEQEKYLTEQCLAQYA